MCQKVIRNAEILDKTENGELKATLMPLKRFSRLFTLGFVMVKVVLVLYFLWFYFNGKGIINTNHNHPLAHKPPPG
jgi:hypothetical protein